MATVIRYTLKLFTAGHMGDGVHSVQVTLTQWNPVPVRGIVMGLAPLIIGRVPDRLPAAVGVNVTFMVHEPGPDSIAGQLFVWPKSPLVEMPVMDTAEEELLLSVTGNDALASEICVPVNIRLEGFAVRAGVTVSIPMTKVEPVVAVTVTAVELLTEPPVTVKVLELAAAATVTGVGTGAAVESELESVTEVPPVGALPFSVTVPVVI